MPCAGAKHALLNTDSHGSAGVSLRTEDSHARSWLGAKLPLPDHTRPQLCPSHRRPSLGSHAKVRCAPSPASRPHSTTTKSEPPPNLGLPDQGTLSWHGAVGSQSWLGVEKTLPDTNRPRLKHQESTSQLTHHGSSRRNPSATPATQSLGLDLGLGLGFELGLAFAIRHRLRL